MIDQRSIKQTVEGVTYTASINLMTEGSSEEYLTVKSITNFCMNACAVPSIKRKLIEGLIKDLCEYADANSLILIHCIKGTIDDAISIKTNVLLEHGFEQHALATGTFLIRKPLKEISVYVSSVTYNNRACTVSLTSKDKKYNYKITVPPNTELCDVIDKVNEELQKKNVKAKVII